MRHTSYYNRHKKAHSIILSRSYTFQRYDLRCITYWDGHHYTCAMKLQNPNAPLSGWYVGRHIQNHSICPNKCKWLSYNYTRILAATCYLLILDSPWAPYLNASVSLNNNYAKTHWCYHTCSDCCEKDAMRYPGRKGIHVMGINNIIAIIIWFWFHTSSH